MQRCKNFVKKNGKLLVSLAAVAVVFVEYAQIFVDACWYGGGELDLPDSMK